MTFDGLFTNGVPIKMVAFNSTTNYLVAKVSKIGQIEYNSVVIFIIHFDPDSNLCSTQGFRTPPKVFLHKVRFFDQGPTSSVSQMWGRQNFAYNPSLKALIVAGYHSWLPN